MDTVNFNAQDHSYVLGKKNLPSVTTVLPDIPEHLLYNQNFITKTLIGNKTHEFAEIANRLYMKKKEILLPHSFVPDNCLQYCLAYKQFLIDVKPKIYAIEERLYHPIYKYAGTLDLICAFMKRKTLFDIKTTSMIKPTVNLQTAAYYYAYNYNRKKSERIERRGIIWLKPDGRYKPILLPIKYLKRDFNVFLCKLKSYQWDLQNL